MKRRIIIAAVSAAAVIAAAGYTGFIVHKRLPAERLTFERDGYKLHGGAAVKEYADGHALELDGRGAYADMTDGAEFNMYDIADIMEKDFSLSVWFKPERENTWARIFDMGTGTEQYICLAQSSSFNPEKPRLSVKYNGIEQSVDSSRVCMMGEWNNVTITHEKGLTRLYLNGIPAGETRNITYNLKDMGAVRYYIGKSMYPADGYFEGMIDDFCVYDRTLGAEEIKAMAGNAYERELERVRKTAFEESGCLDINTRFYNGNTNERIETFTDENNVKVRTVLKNYRNEDTELTLISRKNGRTAAKKNIKLASGEEYEYTYSFSGNRVGEYNVSVKDSLSDSVYDGGTIIKSEVVFPEPPPEESYAAAYGAHDPAIFKDPQSEYYYVYSTHNIIFRTKDLINWEKYRVNDSITVPESCRKFIENNYTLTHINNTYWAPDVVYVAGEEYPYHMYVSVSCGLGGRNSVIGLLKSKTAGFWLDGDDNVIDCGVVIASKEEDGYATNAIDANIYSDTDGNRYFVWGSFWGGVRIAPLNEDGTVRGIDRSSDTALLLTSKTAGETIYTTPNGIAGPEGPWLAYNADNNNRYIFASYGWLGSNYNIRIARMTAGETIENTDDINSAFKDYNGISVGVRNDSAQELWGYKLIGSYRLGDGITYIGQGHNSVLNDNGEWYLVDHCRIIEDGPAFLQVRKMLWTKDGWPVVSPLAYAGEKEQAIPEKMICGTWDLASVGHTIMQNSAAANEGAAYKGSDMPVLSSEIVFEDGGILSGGLGTWEYDGNHTVTLTFARDGIEENYEFYKQGDKMTLFVLAGYDRDKREAALVMTGNDNKGITQFAKKNNSAAYTA